MDPTTAVALLLGGLLLFAVGASVALAYLPSQVDRFAMWWIDRRRANAKAVRERLARPERVVLRAVPVPLGAGAAMGQDDLDDAGTRTEEVRPLARRAAAR